MTRVLFVTRRPPRPIRGGATMRTSGLVDAVATNGCATKVFSIADYAPTSPDMAWLRRPDMLPVDREWSPAGVKALRSVLADWTPDVAVIEGLMTRAAVPTLRDAGCRVIYDAHNVETRLAADQLAARPHALTRIVAARIAKAERELAAAADMLWACSDDDRNAFTSMGATRCVVAPNVVSVDRLAPDNERVPGRVLFSGSFSYWPNRQAVAFLLDLMPRLDPDATLVLAGADPPRDLPAHAWLTATGRRDSFADEFAAAEVMAVPLRVGGGTRFKVLEAMAAGLPVVSTAKGIEALDLAADQHYLAAESLDDFVLAIRRLRDDTSLRSAVTADAHERVAQRYSTAVLATAVGSALAELMSA